MAPLPQPADPAIEIVSRKDAQDRGIKRFFTGIPCKHGHVAQRYVSTSGCVVCVANKRNAWIAENGEWEREYNSRWRKDNHQKVKEQTSRYWERHGAKVNEKRRERRKFDEGVRKKERERSREYRIKNIDRVNESGAEYRAKPENREKARAKAREWYSNNRERAWAANKEWRANNPEEAASLRRAHVQRRRARLAGASGSFTKEDISRLLEAQSYCCAACGKDVKEKYDVDHVIPISRGGSNDPSNLQILCPTCNRSKGSLLPDEWANSEREKWSLSQK